MVLGIGIGPQFSNILCATDSGWTPSTMLGTHDIWYDFLDTAKLTNNTAINILNGTFDADSDWTKEAGWTISGGKAHVDTAGTPRIYQLASLVTGNRYTIDWEITDYTSGLIQIRIGSSHSGDYRSAIGTYSEQATCDGTAYLYFRAAPAVASIDNVINGINHSINQATPVAASGVFAGSVISQSTPTDMPWDDSGTGIRCNIDNMYSDAAASNFNFFHNGEPFFFWSVMKTNVQPGDPLAGILSTKSGGTTTVGIRAYTSNDGSITCNVGNGSAYPLDGTSAAGVLSTSRLDLMVIRYSGSGTNMEVWVGGSKVIDVSATTTFSSSDCAGFSLGGLYAASASSAYKGLITSAGWGHRILSNSDLDELASWAVDTYGVPWT